jgi:HEAT repeat protein
LGPAAATPEILSRLAGLLEDPEWWVRGAAAEAVGALLAQGVRVFREPSGRYQARLVHELAGDETR